MLDCKLINHSFNPENIVAMSAKLCYSDKTINQLLNEMPEVNSTKNFIKKLKEMGHLSPFEHITFTFAIEGISRTLSHQLVRHRIASYSQQSQRYVSEHDFEYILPPSIAENDEAKAKFENLMHTIRQIYDELVAMNVPKEDARYVLANATETKIIVTFNARSLMNFFKLRCCTRAQWEIRKLANLMLKEVSKVAPNIFDDAGATCKKGYCLEGKMSCGLAPTLQSLIKKD